MGSLKFTLKEIGPLLQLRADVPDEPVRVYEFQQTQRNQCLRHDRTDHVSVHLNKCRFVAAFDLVESLVGANRNIIFLEFSLKLPSLQGPLPVRRPYTNVTSVTMSEMVSAEDWDRWINVITRHQVRNIIIGVRDGHRMDGLGQLNMIKNAESLVVRGGECDISDAELRNFSCLDINIKSPNITRRGMREHIAKVTRMANADAEYYMKCRIPAFLPNDGIVNDLLQDEIRQFWQVETVKFSVPAARLPRRQREP